MTEELKYLSDKVLAQLRKDVAANVERYRTSGFEDLSGEPGWDVPLGIDFDPDLLAKLDLTQSRNISAIDLANSKIVGEALPNLSPAVANEERIWARLAHV